MKSFKIGNPAKYLVIISMALIPFGISLGCTSTANNKQHAAVIPKEKPNIIFFITDDMQRYMFNCLDEGKGKNLTPNLDKIAEEGVVLMGQHVSSTVCTPSRYSCLTGQYASRAKNKDFLLDTEKMEGETVVQWNSFITPQNVTIATLLKKQGYTTGFVGKNHAIEAPGWKKLALDADPEDPKVKKALLKNAELIRENISKCGFDFAGGNYQDNPHFLGPEKLRTHNLDWITEKGLDFIDKSGNQPFFLYFATTVPHGPTDGPHSWNGDRKITSEGYLDKLPNVLPDKQSIALRLKEAGFNPNDKTADNEGNIIWIDDALGALISKLKETGKYENTIIVFFNDHGQYAKGSIYQGGTSSPSIFWRNGGFQCGNINKALLSNIDFAPTLLDIAGGDPGKVEHFDGKSFLPILNGKKEQIHESLFFELGFSRGILKDSCKYIALRYPEYADKWDIKERKQILEKWNAHRIANKLNYHFTDPSLPFSHLMLIPGGGDAEFPSTQRYKSYYDKDQLYDLKKDPEEQINLFGKSEYTDKQKELKNELKKYLNDLPGVNETSM